MMARSHLFGDFWYKFFTLAVPKYFKISKNPKRCQESKPAPTARALQLCKQMWRQTTPFLSEFWEPKHRSAVILEFWDLWGISTSFENLLIKVPQDPAYRDVKLLEFTSSTGKPICWVQLAIILGMGSWGVLKLKLCRIYTYVIYTYSQRKFRWETSDIRTRSEE